jgi:GTP-binding protein
MPMIIKSANFVKSAVNLEHYPAPEWPEVAFAGRSNVGKSSVINTLLERRRLAKTSTTPGRTQLINFFLINENLSFVDLPGYGYAKVPPELRRSWGPMVEAYLSGRPVLKAVVLLMDLRRTPLTEELNFIDWLRQYGIAMIPVMTKCDKLSKTEQSKQRRKAAEVLGLSPDELILFSAKTRQGKEPLWDRISTLLGVPDATRRPEGTV